MAKYRATKAFKGKSKAAAPAGASAARAIPCLLLVLGAIALLGLLFYSTLKAGR